MKFVRRLTLSEDTKSFCDKSQACPDVWETTDGIAIIGTDITNTAKQILPSGVNVANTEKIVLIPRELFESAKSNI
jgi:hypothetical protein